MATATLPAPTKGDRRPVRERLLASADELFYGEGINNVGIDRILEHAGVAKASLYSTFGSKDELVRAYLEHRHSTRRARIERHLAGKRSPRERLLSVFDAQAEALAQPGFRGCAFLMANAEQPGESRGKPVCDEYRAWIRALFVRLVKDTGARRAEALARQLLLVYDGATVAAQMDGQGAEAIAAARATAAALLDAATKA
ncbi:TetR/AcrR family transcriptional regulator [Ramlibacter humi]|uniref:TetR/AcrR family transcriptional regulator n=1 Tax=Ramlibacter humi TaxID=2530451 RepID=A0A4Z0BE96_9BURK|nr:TetR/AcrR family transcriptional regulator [Ramlibacter humi]TFY97011.1 TetR/AcrR family transcriptional regulator [Ramlibacter humi]